MKKVFILLMLSSILPLCAMEQGAPGDESEALFAQAAWEGYVQRLEEQLQQLKDSDLISETLATVYDGILCEARRGILSNAESTLQIVQEDLDKHCSEARLPHSASASADLPAVIGGAGGATVVAAKRMEGGILKTPFKNMRTRGEKGLRVHFKDLPECVPERETAGEIPLSVPDPDDGEGGADLGQEQGSFLADPDGDSEDSEEEEDLYEIDYVSDEDSRDESDDSATLSDQSSDEEEEGDALPTFCTQSFRLLSEAQTRIYELAGQGVIVDNFLEDMRLIGSGDKDKLAKIQELLRRITAEEGQQHPPSSPLGIGEERDEYDVPLWAMNPQDDAAPADEVADERSGSSNDEEVIDEGSPAPAPSPVSGEEDDDCEAVSAAVSADVDEGRGEGEAVCARSKDYAAAAARGAAVPDPDSDAEDEAGVDAKGMAPRAVGFSRSHTLDALRNQRRRREKKTRKEEGGEAVEERDPEMAALDAALPLSPLAVDAACEEEVVAAVEPEEEHLDNSDGEEDVIRLNPDGLSKLRKKTELAAKLGDLQRRGVKVEYLRNRLECKGADLEALEKEIVAVEQQLITGVSSPSPSHLPVEGKAGTHSTSHRWYSPKSSVLRIIAPASLVAIIAGYLTHRHVEKQRALGKPTVFDRMRQWSQQKYRRFMHSPK